MSVSKTDVEVAAIWIYAQATATAVVYPDFVPEGVSGIAVVATLLSGQTVGRVMGGAYAWTDLRMRVEVSTETETYADLDSTAAALQSALDGQRGTTTNGVIHRCTQEAPFQQAEVLPGESVRRLGGEYLISAKGS